MTFLTGAEIINDALSIIRNNSTPVRVKMLRWLNVQAQKLAIVRTWTFLGNGSASIVPVDNVLTMPADYGQFQSLQSGTALFLDERNLLPGEAHILDNSFSGLTTPRGYTEGIVEVTVGDVTTKHPIITLHGATVTDAVLVSYTIEPPPITDTADSTSWPSPCRALFMRSLLDYFYEYDMDERAGVSELKKWDNSRKPKTQSSRHGYRRTK